jgi:hypothetical protein
MGLAWDNTDEAWTVPGPDENTLPPKLFCANADGAAKATARASHAARDSPKNVERAFFPMKWNGFFIRSCMG